MLFIFTCCRQSIMKIRSHLKAPTIAHYMFNEMRTGRCDGVTWRMLHVKRRKESSPVILSQWPSVLQQSGSNQSRQANDYWFDFLSFSLFFDANFHLMDTFTWIYSKVMKQKASWPVSYCIIIIIKKSFCSRPCAHSFLPSSLAATEQDSAAMSFVGF